MADRIRYHGNYDAVTSRRHRDPRVLVAADTDRSECHPVKTYCTCLQGTALPLARELYCGPTSLDHIEKPRDPKNNPKLQMREPAWLASHSLRAFSKD